MDKKDKVFQKLNELNISYESIDHPPVYTIEAMEDFELNKIGSIAKNLFLKNYNEKTHYLLILAGDKKADLKSIKSQIESSSLSFASLKPLRGKYTSYGQRYTFVTTSDNSVVLKYKKAFIIKK